MGYAYMKYGNLKGIGIYFLKLHILITLESQILLLTYPGYIIITKLVKKIKYYVT